MDSSRRERLGREISLANSVVDDLVHLSHVALNSGGVDHVFREVEVYLSKARNFLHCLDDIECAIMEGTLERRFYSGDLLHRTYD